MHRRPTYINSTWRGQRPLSIEPALQPGWEDHIRCQSGRCRPEKYIRSAPVAEHFSAQCTHHDGAAKWRVASGAVVKLVCDLTSSLCVCCFITYQLRKRCCMEGGKIPPRQVASGTPAAPARTSKQHSRVIGDSQKFSTVS